jgi:hypothetical protein
LALLPSSQPLVSLPCGRLSIEGLMETIGAVVEPDTPDQLTESNLKEWAVIVFGDCSEEEIFAGLRELGEAAGRSA